MEKINSEKRRKEISQIVNSVTKSVVEGLEIGKDIGLFGCQSRIIPSPFDIAKCYGLRYQFKELDEGVPSYLQREDMIIYISNKYYNNKLAVRNLIAHELGHFFLHNGRLEEMNDFPSKTKEEYEANLFSIFLLPQIVGGEKWKGWEKWRPKRLNRNLYIAYLTEMDN